MSKDHKYKSNNINWIAITLIIAVFFTNISQIPYFVQNDMTQFIAVPMWIILCIICFTNRMIIFKNNQAIFIFFNFVFIFGVLLFTIYAGNDYTGSGLFYSYAISIFIFFIGFWCGCKINKVMLIRITIAYISSALALSFVIYFDYLREGDLSTVKYLYSSKNSASQMIFTALIFLLFMYFPQGKYLKLAKWVGILFEVAVLLMLKSRATILGLLVLFLFIFFDSTIKKEIKLITLMIIMCILAFFFINNDAYVFFIDNIMYAGRDPSDLNNLSSGRIDQITTFPILISGNEFWGMGDYYIESFPLNAWLQYGYILGTVLIVISFYPIIWIISKLSQKDIIYVIFGIISIAYWVDGIFEGLAPFGPGVKCYTLWLLFGILLRKDF